MKNIFKGLGLVLMALLLVVVLMPASAGATLTISSVAVDSAATDAMTIGASNVGGTIGIGVANTGGINIGAGATIQPINIGTGAAAKTIAIGGGTGTLAINTGDWDIGTTGDMTGIGALTIDGNAILGDTAADTITLAGKTSLGTSAAPVSSSAWTGSSWGIGSFLTDDMSVRTGASTYGMYGKVTATGGGADEYVKGVQGVATLATGANVAETFGVYGIVNVDAGTTLNAYGAVGETNVATGTTLGETDVNPNFVTGVLATSYVHTGATLSNDMIDAPLIAQVQQGAAARKKATAAVVALLQGDNGQSNTAGAALKVMDRNTTYNFDYGLDLYYLSGAMSNIFTVTDIRLSNGTNIYSGTAVTRAAVQTATGNDAPIGSLYVGNAAVATTKPNLYVKILDVDGSATNWERVVTQASD